MEGKKRRSTEKEAAAQEQHIMVPEMKTDGSQQSVGFALAIAAMPGVNLKKPEEVKASIAAFFALCTRCDRQPTVAGMALALGMDRHRLRELGVGGDAKLPKATTDLLHTAYRTLELLWEQELRDGLLGVSAGIFLGKNLFDYRDQAELTLTRAPSQAELRLTPEELNQRLSQLRAGVAEDGE